MSGGFEEIVLSAFAIERIATPMVEVGGYRCVALPDAPLAQFAAWQVPAACTRIEQWLLTPPDDTRGHLRVVVFHGVERQLMRPSQRTWDSGGIFDVDIFTRDAAATYRKLQAHGWTAFGEPADYVIGEFDVCEVVVIGPDGLVIGLIEPRHDVKINLPSFRAMSRLFNSTQIVRDLDMALVFYHDVLGWKTCMQATVVGPGEPGSILGLPMPACAALERRVAILHPDGDNDGSIELIQIAGIDGRDHAARGVAPNVGLLSLRFPTGNARGYAAEIVARGGRLYTQPAALEIAPYGPVTLFSVRSPDGAILEFFERGRPSPA